MNDRSWRIVAGQRPSDQFCAATVPDGSNCHWKSGEIERVEAKNRAVLKAAEEAEIEANGYFTEPDRRKVISPDGARCFVTRLPAGTDSREQVALRPIPDDLTVPIFLRRTAA